MWISKRTLEHGIRHLTWRRGEVVSYGVRTNGADNPHIHNTVCESRSVLLQNLKKMVGQRPFFLCVFFSRAHVSKGVLNFLVWRGFVELGKYGRRFYAHAHFVTASLLLLSFRREEVLGGFFIVFSSCLASLVVCMWVISDLVGLNQNWRENSNDTDR